MAFSPPQCAVNMEQRLAALKRDQEIDGLRMYLIKYNLFPRNRDPLNSPIRVEELKELVKHWKLHRQRGFWRDHPEKDDLVRALLHHIRSEAANKKRRQEAQEKYNRSTHKAGSGSGCGGAGAGGGGGIVGSGEMSAAAKRDFSMILGGGKELFDKELLGSNGSSSESSEVSAKSFLKRKMGGDLFYQRGDYDEGMIYLSRVDKSKFASEDQNPRNELLTTSASSPIPLGHLVQMGNNNRTHHHHLPHHSTSSDNNNNNHPVATDKAVAMPAGVTTWSHSPTSLGPTSPGGAHSGSVVALTREMKLKSVEGLFNVSCHRGFEAQVLREGALATIAALLKIDDAAIRLLSAATLLNLTAIATTSASGSALVGSPLLHHHQPHNNAAKATVPTAAASLLAPPTAPVTAKEIYGRMMDEGVLTSLLELAHTPHPMVKTLCARALFRFTTDEAHHFRMVHEGVVVALTQLLTAIPGDDLHRQACVHALVNLAAIPRAVTCDAILNPLVALAKHAVALALAPPVLIAPTTGAVSRGSQEPAASQPLTVNAHVMLRGCAQALLNLSILPTTRSSMVDEGAMLALSVLASTKQLPLCETVTSVLCNCASIRTNQEPMVKNGAAALLGDLLELVNTSLTQLRQQQHDQHDLGDHESDREVATMAKQLLHRIRRNCVNAIAHFCCNPKLQVRAMNAGFVPKLLAILRLGSTDANASDDEHETTKFCIISLANLAFEDRCRPTLVQDGAVEPLLRVLNSDEPAADADTAATGGEKDDDGAASASAPPRQRRTLLKLDCVTALSNLMLHPKNFTRMVDEGVVPALLAMIQRSDNAEIQRACVYAMLNMANDPAMKTKLAQATSSSSTTDAANASAEPEPPGAVPTMLAFASKQLQNAELCAVCVSFLYHLSTRAENYGVLYLEGAVALLVRVLQKKCTTEPVHVIYALWEKCMATLSNLASHAEKRATFLSDGVLEAMQRVLAAASGDTRRRDRRLETTLVMLQFAASQILCKLQELCCGARSTSDVPSFFASLLSLATASATKNSRLERRAVRVQHKTVLRCALTIARATTLSQKGLRLLAAHADFAPALNGIMRTGLHEPQVCAAIALCNLATERGKLKPRVWRDATTDDFVVVTLLRLNSDQTKEICAKALFNLLTHDDTRDQMVKDGVLYALIKLSLRLDSEEIRDLCLRSIYNISLVGSAQQQLLLDMEIVRVLAKMYQPEFSKEMKRLLCGILSNLSAVPGHEHQILQEGALSVLRHLAKVRDPETKVYAANILYNLACCVDVVDTLVRGSGGNSGGGGRAGGGGGGGEGVGGEDTAASGGAASATANANAPTNVLGLLVALLKSENRDVRRYAALTMANLSGNALAVQLMTESNSSSSSTGEAPASTASASSSATMVGVLNDVLKRTMASCVETTASCVFALRNLLTVAVNLQRFIDGNGVVTLATILGSSEMESETRTLHVATDLLCALANFEQGATGFEERLVKDGIIRALHAIAKSGATGSSSSSSSSSAAAVAMASMNIMTALSNLSRNPRCHDLMLRDGVLDTVALLARTASSGHGHGDDARVAFKGLVAVKGEEFGHHCAVVLRNLAHQDGSELSDPTSHETKGQRLSSQAGVVQILLALAQATTPETREHVVVALHNMAVHRRCRMQLLKNDGVKVILRLCASATSAVKRHICGLTLQLLSKQSDRGHGDDPHSGSIKQEGLVTAIASLAEPHHHDLLLLAAKALHAIETPRPLAASTGMRPSTRVDEAALLAATHAPVAQQGAPPDWAKVTIANLAPWPTLETLAANVIAGKDEDEDGEDDEDDGDDSEDGDHDVFATGTTAAMTTRAPMSPSNSRLRAPSRLTSSTTTAPRVCSSDTVLGSLQWLEDATLDKIKLSYIEAELTALTQRRVRSGAAGGDELPALLMRPATAPDGADDSPASGKATKSHATRSTLSLAREDAAGSIISSSTRSPHASPLKSPSSSSLAGATKRKSRTLEPLAVSSPSDTAQ